MWNVTVINGSCRVSDKKYYDDKWYNCTTTRSEVGEWNAQDARRTVPRYVKNHGS